MQHPQDADMIAFNPIEEHIVGPWYAPPTPSRARCCLAGLRQFRQNMRGLHDPLGQLDRECRINRAVKSSDPLKVALRRICPTDLPH